MSIVRIFCGGSVILVEIGAVVGSMCGCLTGLCIRNGIGRVVISIGILFSLVVVLGFVVITSISFYGHSSTYLSQYLNSISNFLLYLTTLTILAFNFPFHSTHH